ncbi:MAG TPA: carbamoyltransferase C-terminal domain-containing protein [Vicinamibacterales bacterium]|nr:carbamoyltransferase C-terminal domain-containing protein [Vicinamibacterales bacterium]
MPLHLGIGGVTRHGCAALSDDRRVLGICEQERITRARGAGCDANGIPGAALDALLGNLGRTRASIDACAVAEDVAPAAGWPVVKLEHHEGHASAAYLTSPFDAATILICDHGVPGVTVWQGRGRDVVRVEWPWTGIGFSDLYAECATLLGFGGDGGEQRFEALARMMSADPDTRVPLLFRSCGNSLQIADGWQERALAAAANAETDVPARARIAAALQQQIANAVLDLAGVIQAHVPSRQLCLGGSLFHHSAINSAVRNAGIFERVFVPANPGNAGVAVGAAMRLSKLMPANVSPFMGPVYDADETKATLDNCKLRYDWLDEGAAVQTAVHHLQHGRLVGWFEGRMEWGPRALGARSILANPFSPYVLENLNRFLKRREAWRGYALCAPESEVQAQFDGPAEAPFMECDYRPRDVARFRSVMPSPAAHLRVQTVNGDCPRGFRAVLDAFGQATGIPCLVNTSFNGFHEPIVCTPRDAVRVFFGSGLDVLVLDRFVLTK